MGLQQVGLDGSAMGILHKQEASGGDVFHRCFSITIKLVFKTNSSGYADESQNLAL